MIALPIELMMERSIQIEATVYITVKDLAPIDDTDSIEPTEPMIVSLSSPKIDTVTIFCLGSTDNKTDSSNIRYEVHISTDSNFSVDSTTLKQTLVGTLEADIGGLDSNTLYYVKIKAMDASNNFSISGEKSIKTLEESVELNSNIEVEKASDLALYNPTEDGDKLIFQTFSNSKPPKSGAILIGDSDNPYLKRVVSVNKNQDKIEVKTEDTTISDVINTGKVSSKTVLFNTQNDVDSSALKRMVRYKTDYKKESTQIWKSGRFSVTDIKNLNSKNSKYLQKSNISNNYYEITIADNDIVVNAEKTLQVDIKAKMKDEGITEGYKFNL